VLPKKQSVKVWTLQLTASALTTCNLHHRCNEKCPAKSGRFFLRYNFNVQAECGCSACALKLK
jgi:hypothetical protein